MVRKQLIRFNLVLAATAMLITSSPMTLIDASSMNNSPVVTEESYYKGEMGDFSDDYYDTEYFDRETLRWRMAPESLSSLKFKYGISAYTCGTIYDMDKATIKDTTIPSSVRTTATEEYGTLYCNGTELKNFSDISSCIQVANTVYKYAEGRKRFVYYSGYSDNMESIEKNQSTTYYFTAPIDGIIRFRWVHLEDGNGANFTEEYNMIGVGILDTTTNKFVSQEYSTPIDELGSRLAYYITGTVEKGKTYKLVFNSVGVCDRTNFEMYYMNLFKNGNGVKSYKPNKTYVYASQVSAVLSAAKGKKEYTERVRKNTVKITLKKKSKVTFSLLNLVCYQEDWESIGSKYQILYYTKLSKGTVKVVKEVQFDESMDFGAGWCTFSVVLDEGSYSFPLALSSLMYDYAFKYSVTPIE